MNELNKNKIEVSTHRSKELDSSISSEKSSKKESNLAQYDTSTLNNEKRINDDIEKRIEEFRNKIILKDANKFNGFK